MWCQLSELNHLISGCQLFVDPPRRSPLTQSARLVSSFCKLQQLAHVASCNLWVSELLLSSFLHLCLLSRLRTHALLSDVCAVQARRHGVGRRYLQLDHGIHRRLSQQATKGANDSLQLVLHAIRPARRFSMALRLEHYLSSFNYRSALSRLSSTPTCTWTAPSAWTCCKARGRPSTTWAQCCSRFSPCSATRTHCRLRMLRQLLCIRVSTGRLRVL